MSSEKLQKVLGLNEYQPKTKYVCFLPFIGEFGWMITTFVKRIQGYNHANKIVCTKRGHECLYPSATQFFYDWQDIPDHMKAGIYEKFDHEEIIKEKIKTQLNTDDIHFCSPSETSWDEKKTLANNIFIPKSNHNLGLKTDIVITPRNRKMDPDRNWRQENWQLVVDELAKLNITVGVCGAKDSTFQLDNIKYKSYDYIDVDSDVELMTNAQLVITQESGLQYLSFLCQRPTFCIDRYHRDFGADLHRNQHIPFRELMRQVWDKPQRLVGEIQLFLDQNK
jgi:hypothetical protein